MKPTVARPICRGDVLLPPADWLAVSPDGRVLATVHGATLRLADLEMGEGTFCFEEAGPIVAMALSASSVAVVVGARIRLYNVLAGRLLYETRTRAEHLAFDGRGERLLAREADGRVRAYRALGLRQERGKDWSLGPVTRARQVVHPDGIHELVLMETGVILRPRGADDEDPAGRGA